MSTDPSPRPSPLIPVLWESDDLLAIEKPLGIATIPGRGETTSVVEQLSAARGRKLFVVHRLDKDVSGVLLLAKHAAAHRILSGLFERREINKTYTAVVHGTVFSATGVIRAPLREFSSGRMGVDNERGKPSETKYTVLQRFREYTLLSAEPTTGRRHQLRVHFYHLGHAIVGDQRYGDSTIQAKFPRLFLHATEIQFDYPPDTSVHVRSPLPLEFHQGWLAGNESDF